MNIVLSFLIAFAAWMAWILHTRHLYNNKDWGGVFHELSRKDFAIQLIITMVASWAIIRGGFQIFEWGRNNGSWVVAACGALLVPINLLWGRFRVKRLVRISNQAEEFGEFGRDSSTDRPYEDWKSKLDGLEEKFKTDLSKNGDARSNIIEMVEEDEEFNQFYVQVADISYRQAAQDALANTQACLAYLKDLPKNRSALRRSQEQAIELDKATQEIAAPSSARRRL